MSSVYVYNPSPVALSISVNNNPVQGSVQALPSPDYTPMSLKVPFGPTGGYAPPINYPPNQPHFVPPSESSNLLVVTYLSADPSQPLLGLKFKFEFSVDTAGANLLLFCFRDLIWLMDQFGTTLNVVGGSPCL
jgi:hypothetical protein